MTLMSLSTASTTQGYSQSVSSPYSGQARLLQHPYHGSPLIQSKPVKRSATPEHVLSEAGVEMRQLGRGGGGGGGGVNTVVSSPGRQSLQSQYHSATPGPPGPLYSQASRGLTPSTTYNPGYQVEWSTLIGPDTLLGLVEPYYAGTKVYAITTHLKWHFVSFGVLLWHDKWLPCMERAYYINAIKNFKNFFMA